MICENDKCTGCGLCSSVCPKNAISLIEDDFGFLYPKVDEDKCINCDLCKKMCPVLGFSKNNNPIPKAYMCWSLDKNIVSDSSSGGLFTEIANYILENNGYIVGCELDDKFNCKHVVVTNKEELSSIRGSKYVQSNISEIFLQVKEILNKNKKVLFVGCPCQVAALIKFIGKKADNLFTIDLICHGVPSNAFFKKYIADIEKKYKRKVIGYKFRSNIKEWRKYVTEYSFEDGLKVHKLAIDDPFMACYLKCAIYRESCYNCMFNGFPRVADLTLGDYSGVTNKEAPNDAIKNGISCCIINNKKGEFLFNQISDNLYFEEKNINYVVNTNKNINFSSHKPKCRDAILSSDKSLFYCKKKYCNYKIGSIIATRLFSVNFINSIRKVIKK